MDQSKIDELTKRLSRLGPAELKHELRNLERHIGSLERKRDRVAERARLYLDRGTKEPGDKTLDNDLRGLVERFERLCRSVD